MPDGDATRATRLPGELDTEFREYAEERDMTNSEALRSLIRQSLRDDGQEIGNSFVTMVALTIAGLALLGTVPFLVFLVFGAVPILPGLSAIVAFVAISLYFSYIAARAAELSLKELVIKIYFPVFEAPHGDE